MLQMKIAAINRLQLFRTHDNSVSEDKRLIVSTQFVNGTFIGLRLEIFDNYPAFFRLKTGSNSALLEVPARGYTKFQYEIAPTSVGKHEFGVLQLVMRDLAGLFFYQRDIEVQD